MRAQGPSANSLCPQPWGTGVLPVSGYHGVADRSVVDHVLLVTTQWVGCSGKPDGSTRAVTISIRGDAVDPAAAVDDLAFFATNSASACSIG